MTYYEAHREERLAYQRAWLKAHPGYAKARREAKRLADDLRSDFSEWTEADWSDVDDWAELGPFRQRALRRWSR